MGAEYKPSENRFQTSFKREKPVFENEQTANESIHLMTAMENGVISQFIIPKNENRG